MASISDDRRTAGSIKAVRKRYIRRAEYLCTNPEFLEALEAARDAWESAWPDFPIVPPPAWHWINPPISVIDAWFRDEVDGRPPEAGNIGTTSYPPVVAWRELMRRMVNRFFPRIDYSGVESTERRHVCGFIAAAIQGEPSELPGRCGSFFTLEPHIALRYEPRLTEGSISISIPADMADKDIRDHLTKILKAARKDGQEFTTAARIDAYRALEWSYTEIANQLGLEVETVRSHLRQSRIRPR